MKPSISITRRLTTAVLLLEILAGVVLIAAITIHEHQVRLSAFNVGLEAGAKSLLAAVQESRDPSNGVQLDMAGVHVERDAIYRVVDESSGRVLGSVGDTLFSTVIPPGPSMQNEKIAGRTYRLFVLHGVRIIDPGQPDADSHNIAVVYGRPLAYVWHQVIGAVRFFAVATVILLIFTALLMVWMIRKQLRPIYELARQAEQINSTDWQFTAPPGAMETVELRPLASALKAALARLQRSFEQQRRFVSDAAHELKTDAAIVKSSLQLLRMRERTTEEYRRGLEQGLEDFTRLESTVQKMLTLARVEHSGQEESAACNLKECVETAIRHNQPYAEMRSIQVRANLPGGPRVGIDSRDAVLLCSNLLLNALQHSPEETAVEVNLAVKKSVVELTIRDHGAGVAEQEIPFLFEPFYRGDPSRSRKSGGTGLGLSIAKAICERAGGSIAIANHIEGGALVTVTLPVLLSQEQPASPVSAQASV
jgi:signal transduction histidine kinase